MNKKASNKPASTVSNIPTHTGYIVTKKGDKENWREVCAVWLHEDGKGFNVQSPEGIALMGKIVFRLRKDKPAYAE